MYRDSTAYDFERFAPKKKEVVELSVERRATKSATSSRGWLVTAVGVIVVLLLVAAQLNCLLQTSETSDEITQIKKNIEVLKSENTRMQVELEGKVSFTNMETAAKEMGMKKITVAQTEYINLCDQDASEVTDQENGALAAVQELF
ncbi:MAG: hypothetical protein IKT68_00055 [Clostridia bacterium]|nr:hypothetical protein [Clostridia bacterium]